MACLLVDNTYNNFAFLMKMSGVFSRGVNWHGTPPLGIDMHIKDVAGTVIEQKHCGLYFVMFQFLVEQTVRYIYSAVFMFEMTSNDFIFRL